jgi:hypothetical protein
LVVPVGSMCDLSVTCLAFGFGSAISAIACRRLKSATRCRFAWQRGELHVVGRDARAELAIVVHPGEPLTVRQAILDHEQKLAGFNGVGYRPRCHLMRCLVLEIDLLGKIVSRYNSSSA